MDVGGLLNLQGLESAPPAVARVHVTDWNESVCVSTVPGIQSVISIFYPFRPFLPSIKLLP